MDRYLRVSLSQALSVKKDDLDERTQLFDIVRVYPLLVEGVRRAAFDEGFADLPVDPITRQYRV